MGITRPERKVEMEQKRFSILSEEVERENKAKKWRGRKLRERINKESKKKESRVKG